MPFSRHPLDYPINRLLLKVGLAQGSWVPLLPPAETPELKEATAAFLASYLGLEEALHAELLSRYHFCWSKTGVLRRIQLVPHPKVRRTPGIKALKALFFPTVRSQRSRPGSRRKRRAKDAGASP